MIHKIKNCLAVYFTSPIWKLEKLVCTTRNLLGAVGGISTRTGPAECIFVFSKPTEKAPNKYNFRPNISNCFVMGEGE